MITLENGTRVIAPSNVVPGSARTVGGDLVFEIDGQITQGSLACIIQTMGFDSVGFPNTQARVVSVQPVEEEGRHRVVIRPSDPVAQPVVQYR